MALPVRTHVSRRALLTAGCLVTAAVVTACANVLQGDGAGGGGAAGQPGSTAYGHLSGPDDVLVSVRSDGGYSPVQFTLRNTAEFVLLGDGTAIVRGPMIEIYPGPAIMPLQSSSLTEQQIQDLFAAADQAGPLGDEIDFGEPGVTDMPQTTVRITAGDRTYSQSAYALGFSDDQASGLSEAEIAAREGLQSFIDRVRAAVGTDNAPYVPDAVAVFRLSSDQSTVDQDLEQEPLVWPISTLPPPTGPAEAHSCIIITGAEAAELVAVLEGANELTPWLIDADPPAYLAFRPLLPDDSGCEK